MIKSPSHRLTSPAKALWLFLFLVLISLGLVSAKPVPATPTPAPSLPVPDYFYTVDLDPLYQFVGTGALTEEVATPANCYHYSYNDAGKLKQIEYRRAGALMSDPLLGVASIDFEYQPGIERRWYHDAEGKPVNNTYGIAGEELTLNNAGFPIEIANLDATGASIRDSGGVIRYVRTLDEHNRVIALRRIGLLGTAITDKSGFFETRTSYDNQGRPVERDNYDNSGSLLNDDDGVATVRTIYTNYPDSTQTIASYFDAAGLPAEDKGSGIHTIQRGTDKNGFLVSEAYFDNNDAPCIDNETNIHERHYKYDDRGNLVSEEFFGVDGKPTNQKASDFARVTYKYDEKNRVIEKAYFGDDGAPQILANLGAATIRQEYDDQGNLVHRQFFDGQGHPSAHVDYGAPAIRIKVEGDTTTVSLRNADDQPMKNPIQGYYAFSYKTDTDKPLTRTNIYFDRYGQKLSYFPRVSVINPHLYALKSDYGMRLSARIGAGAVGLGALLGAFLALRKSSHTKRRKVYVPVPFERFLGWFAVLAIFEGTLRFFLTIYWAGVGYLNGQMGPGIYILEAIFIIFFLYRLMRLRVTMRVLNVEKKDIHRLVQDFFTKANIKSEWIEARNVYTTPHLDVRVNFFQGKYHAYLAFQRKLKHGRYLAKSLAKYIRLHVRDIKAPVRTRTLALYYPSVALCYFLLSGTAFYTLWQLMKRY